MTSIDTTEQPVVHRPAPRATWWLAAATIAPIAAVLVALLIRGEHWYPTGDLAHTELMLRAIPRHPPLVGVAARVGTIEDPGSTPGPSMAYLLLPVYVLFARTSFGLIVAVNALHAAAIVGAIWLVGRRYGRGAAAACALAVVIMIRGLMSTFFVEPWNVWVPVFAFVVYLLLAWDVADERSRSLPWMVAIGSHCAQTHISYLPLVGGTMAAAVGWLLLRRRHVIGRLWRDLSIAGLVGVLSMLPPIYEQLTRSPGNLRRLWHHFGNPPAPYVGVRAGWKAFAGEFNLLGPWITGRAHDPTQAPNAIGFVAMVALLSFGFAVAWRRRDRVVVRLYAVFGVVGAIGLFAVSRVFGEFFDYVIRWIWPINAIGTLAAMLAIGRAVAARRIGFAPRLRRLAVVVTAIVSIVAVLQAGSAHIPGRLDSRLVGGLATGAQTGLSPQARYLLRWHDPQALGAAGFGLVLEMERRGFHVGVDAWARAGSQPFRVQPEDSAASVLWLVVGDRAIDEFARRGDAVLLTRFDPRTPAEAARSDAVRAELDRRFNETGRRDLIDKLDIQYGTTQVRFFEHLPDDLQQLVVEYNDLRSPGAIFEVPPFAPLFTLS